VTEPKCLQSLLRSLEVHPLGRENIAFFIVQLAVLSALGLSSATQASLVDCKQDYKSFSDRQMGDACQWVGGDDHVLRLPAAADKSHLLAIGARRCR
jgi:hypothetical protein